MKRLLLIFSLFALINPIHADEGMWLLTMLNKLNLQQKGCKLTPEQIYSINHSSLKDAVVGLGESDNPFNFFCTSELVSSQGLVFTNYHCGFDMIQKHTSIENNYIENGFWAKNRQEELPNDGITATIVYKMIDVSNRIMPLYALGIKDQTKLQDTIAKVSALIAKSVSDTSSYFGDVQGFFENNQFFLFVYEKFEDVRLVGAPPRAIGKFGGDTDNWMWPRHTGDFCVLRIYGNDNSKPAPFSINNKPITPRYYLPVSVKGYEKGDYAMVMGFPGSTDRYLTSKGIDGLLKYNNASVITIGDEMLAVYRKFMNSDPTIKIKYAAKYDEMSNYWKYAIGQNQGIVALDVINRKMSQEEEFTKWIKADKTRKARYGKVLKTISSHYETTNEAKYASNFMNIGLLNSPELFIYTYDLLDFIDVISKGDTAAINIQTKKVREAAIEHFKNYDVNVDIAQFVAMSKIYQEKVPEKYWPTYFGTVKKDFGGDFKAFADVIYGKSIFANEKKTLAFIDNPDSKVFMSDLAMYLLRNTFPAYYKIDTDKNSEKFDNAKHLYLEAILKQNPDSLYYPDANSTQRLTYGYVGDYTTPQGVHFNYVTYLPEVIKKEDPKNPEEFSVPDKLKELYTSKDYGMYADKTGEVPVCFTTNNDITGGNSGSPVMNANGELIGIAFDGNWEAMSGDIIFEPKIQKCINVDIRYVLFIIDKLGGAKYLVDEMTIVK
jgi:hypothetical protein